MKFSLLSERSKAIFFIGLVAISIGAISKKVIRYQTERCIKGKQELTFKKEIKHYFL